MADSYLEKVAGELADLALADEARSGDEDIINDVSEIVGSSSQTLQEAFLTAVRVRRAEARAREMLAERTAKHDSKPGNLLTNGAQSSATPKPPEEKPEDQLKAMLDEVDRERQTKTGPRPVMPTNPNRR